MPLDFGSSGGGMPFLRFSIEDNAWKMSNDGGDLVEVDWSAPVLVDIERIRLGWLRLAGGRDFQEWPGNNQTSRPSEEYKSGFIVQFYSSQLFGDAPVRELSSDRAGLQEFIKKLYNEVEAAGKFESGEIPAIKMLPAIKTRIGKGPTKIPQYELLGYKPRPADMENGGSDSGFSSSAADPAPPAADDSFADMTI